MLVLFLRALLLYIVIFIVMRLMGKRQVSDLQPFDLVVTLLIADLAGNPITDTTIPMIYGILPILAMFLLQQLMAYLSLKSERIRSLLSGKPLFIIKNSVLQEDMMKKANYTLNDLLEQLRAKEIFSLSEVAYAVLETDGTLSVLKAGKEHPPTLEDLSLPPHPAVPTNYLVLDGKVHPRALKAAGRNEAWLRRELKGLGITNLQDAFFVSFNRATGELYAQRRQQKHGPAPVLLHRKTGGADG